MQLRIGVAGHLDGLAAVFRHQVDVPVDAGAEGDLEGDIEGATKVYERGVESSEGDPRRKAYALDRLATYIRPDDPQRSETLAREALALHEQQMGPDHPSQAEFESTLAETLITQRKREEAAALLGRALERSKAVWGPDHPALATHLMELADLECKVSFDYEKGRAFVEEALRVVGKGPTILRVRILKAREQCLREGEPTEARDAAKDALDLSRELYGEVHIQTVYARTYYGIALARSGDLTSAREQLVLIGTAFEDEERWPILGRLSLRSMIGGLASHLGGFFHGR